MLKVEFESAYISRDSIKRRLSFVGYKSRSNLQGWYFIENKEIDFSKNYQNYSHFYNAAIAILKDPKNPKRTTKSEYYKAVKELEKMSLKNDLHLSLYMRKRKEQLQEIVKEFTA